MKLARLELERFTAFEQVAFEFTPGVNVLIGENGTGKSHLLKLIYCVSESVRRHATGEGTEPGVAKTLAAELTEALMAVFQPDELNRLVRRARGRRTARVKATWRDAGQDRVLEFELTTQGRLGITKQSLPDLERSIFIPTREVLSIFPGFIASYVRRESAFDRTVYDLCVALDAKPLRGPRDTIRATLLQPIEEALGGTVVNDRGHFYLKLPDGNMEAPLVAEGIRKLGMLHYLILNGSLTEKSFLLWDEPEASLNPRLTRLTGHIALGLARTGVQTWIATHDYLLTSELDLAAERQGTKDAAFFALVRSDDTEGTIVEHGPRLASLTHNSILAALTDLHDREDSAFLGASE